jgi:hypothetical protein
MWRAIARSTFSARLVPSMRRYTSPAANANSSTPTMAAVTYAVRKPFSGMEMSSAIQRIRLSTTAEPSPTVANVNPAAVGVTPAVVKRL